MISESGAKRKKILALGDGQPRYACAAPEAGNVKARAIGIWPLQAIPSQGAVNEFRIDLFQTVIVEARPFQTARPFFRRFAPRTCGRRRPVRFNAGVTPAMPRIVG